VDYHEMRDDLNTLLLKLSNFLQKPITKPDKLFFSWNKDRGEFFNNSSFGTNKNKFNDDVKYDLRIKKFSNYVNGANYIDLNFFIFIKKLKKTLSKLL
jgi:hypothetical protein